MTPLWQLLEKLSPITLQYNNVGLITYSILECFPKIYEFSLHLLTTLNVWLCNTMLKNVVFPSFSGNWQLCILLFRYFDPFSDNATYLDNHWNPAAQMQYISPTLSLRTSTWFPRNEMFEDSSSNFSLRLRFLDVRASCRTSVYNPDTYISG